MAKATSDLPIGTLEPSDVTFRPAGPAGPTVHSDAQDRTVTIKDGG